MPTPPVTLLFPPGAPTVDATAAAIAARREGEHPATAVHADSGSFGNAEADATRSGRGPDTARRRPPLMPAPAPTRHAAAAVAQVAAASAAVGHRCRRRHPRRCARPQRLTRHGGSPARRAAAAGAAARAQRVRGRSAQQRQRRRLPRPPVCGPPERRRAAPCGSRCRHATQPQWGRPPPAPRERGAGLPPGATARTEPPLTARSGGGGAPAPASAVGVPSRGVSLPPSCAAHGRHRRAATPDPSAGCGFRAPPTHGGALAPKRQPGGRRTVSPPQSPARSTAPGGGGGAYMDGGRPHSRTESRLVCK